ncbi:ester cyclase [Kutzneria sp. NPDC051319]|uniref:ester cyclase n=1 Tax=Kutzneria sp. NPDC051319 TaxID=3155047 RepID=UPI003432B691
MSVEAQADIPHSQQPPHVSSLVEHNTELGREFVVLENEHDDTRRQQLADSIVSPAYIQHNAIVAPGRAGLLAFFHGIRTVMPDVKFTARDIFATGSRVVSRFTITGTVTGGPFLDIPPSGQKLEWDGIDVWTVRDGQLYEHWDQFDWPRALIQLGVQGLPQPFVQAAGRPPTPIR